MINGSLEQMTRADAHAWAARQTYIALGFFLSACAMAGVDACPMEGFQPEKYDEILGLREKGVSAVVLATAGYRLESDPSAQLSKSRLDVADVVERI
jgi:nitroreductase